MRQLFRQLYLKLFMKTKTKPIELTKAARAKELGLSKQNLYWHSKQPGAPKWDAPKAAWVEYLAINERDTSNLPPELKKQIGEQRLRLVRAQAEKIELENAGVRHEQIEWNTVSRFLGEVLGKIYFGELERMQQTFPASMVGKDAAAIQVDCQQFVGDLVKAIRLKLDAWVASKGAK